MVNILKKIGNKQIKIYPIVYLVLSLLLGFVLGLLTETKKITPQNTERHESGYFFISPLIEWFSDKSDSPENTKIQAKVEKLIAEKTAANKIVNVSIYFRDLSNGPWIGINENEKFTPASLLKVPIMMTYYKMAENNPSILQEELLVNSNHENQVEQNIKPEKTVEIGKKYTINELIRYMLIESDNRAAGTLLDRIPFDVLKKTYSDLGLDLPTLDKPENYMAVKDYASFFRILYNASYLDKYYSEQALEIMSESIYTQGLQAGVPSDVKVSHKFGERNNDGADQLHDCGIVYKQNKDYLLCVMTRGNNFNDLSETIKDVSKLFYDNVN